MNIKAASQPKKGPGNMRRAILLKRVSIWLEIARGR
jgi:hypothetical protein